MISDKDARDRLIAMEVGTRVNRWLHEKGQEVHNYVIFLDRCCDISDVAKEAIAHIDKFIEENPGWKERIFHRECVT